MMFLNLSGNSLLLKNISDARSEILREFPPWRNLRLSSISLPRVDGNAGRGNEREEVDTVSVR